MSVFLSYEMVKFVFISFQSGALCMPNILSKEHSTPEVCADYWHKRKSNTRNPLHVEDLHAAEGRRRSDTPPPAVEPSLAHPPFHSLAHSHSRAHANTKTK